jgi:8-oxo-dGTP pyrophosphatase MutT (NUDIX family)
MDPSRASITARLADFPRTEASLEGRKAAAVAVALVEDDGGVGVLLTRRAARMRAHAGQWALPGGRTDGGESSVDAARREMHEELGVLVAADAVLGLLDDYPTRSGYVITPVVLWAGRVGDLTPNPDEVASVHVIPLADVDVDARFIAIEESDAPVIQLPLFGTYVHAPTAAVLHQFREVGLHGRSTRVAHYEQPVFAWR